MEVRRRFSRIDGFQRPRISFRNLESEGVRTNGQEKW